MKNEEDAAETQCLNCGATVNGEFCHSCGQRVRDNSDRSLGRLFGEFINTVFLVDNRFLLSVWYLIRYPALMTVEFLEGKRKKYISPVTLFLFMNLIYFFLSPLNDYSLPLSDQTYMQPHSPIARNLVDSKLQKEEMTFEEYSVIYQKASDDVSKSIMIVNVPIIAIILYLITFRKRRFYFDSLIFSFHFFTIFISSWMLLGGVAELKDYLPGDVFSIVASISFNMFTLIIPLIYAILGIKRFMNINWLWAIPAGAGVFIATMLSNLLYRPIVFFITFLAT